jgi:uncharacterized protein DUF3644
LLMARAAALGVPLRGPGGPVARSNNLRIAVGSFPTWIRSAAARKLVRRRPARGRSKATSGELDDRRMSLQDRAGWYVASMDYRGSYRHLARNSRAALLAAVELYNKPRIDYREETVVILLLNAWELLLKAILSRRKHTIFYPKKRGQPYRTLSWPDALERANGFFPTGVDALAVQKNLELLATYRDHAVHFYNARDFKVLIYGLAQTCVLNYRDLLSAAFGIDLAKDITWRLLPIGVELPVDPLEYLRKRVNQPGRQEAAVKEFLGALSRAAGEIAAAKGDTERLLTPMVLKLTSTKKLDKADLVVGVERSGGGGPPVIIERPSDPNLTHPLRQRDIVAKIEKLHGRDFTTGTFQALVWKHRLKEDRKYCWSIEPYGYKKWSSEVLVWLRQLTEADIDAALKDYRDHQRQKGNRGGRRPRR